MKCSVLSIDFDYQQEKQDFIIFIIFQIKEASGNQKIKYEKTVVSRYWKRHVEQTILAVLCLFVSVTKFRSPEVESDICIPMEFL